MALIELGAPVTIVTSPTGSLSVPLEVPLGSSGTPLTVVAIATQVDATQPTVLAPAVVYTPGDKALTIQGLLGLQPSVSYELRFFGLYL